MNKIKSIFRICINSLFFYLLYLIPYTFLAASQRVLAVSTMIVLSIIFLSIDYYKKKYREIVKIEPSEYLNMFVYGLIFTIGYFLILRLIPAKFSYYNQFYYLNIYEYLSTPMYLLITVFFLPFLETMLIKSRIARYKNKKVKYVLVATNVFLIFFVQPYFIYGIFFGAISLFTSIILLKSKNLHKSLLTEMIINLVFSSYILYYGEYKLILTMIAIFLFITCLLVNVLKMQKNS